MLRKGLRGADSHVMLCAPTAQEFAVVRRALQRLDRGSYNNSPSGVPLGFRLFSATIGRREYWLFQTGLGVWTSVAVGMLCQAVEFDAICLLGYAGGVDPKLTLGLCVEPSTVRLVACGAANMPISLGVGQSDDEMLTLDEPALSQTAKAEIMEEYEIGVVDMEAFYVGQRCRELQKPFHVVKVVSDAAADELPREIVACVRPNGDLSSAHLAGTLAIRPRLWPKLAKLWKQNRVAARALERSVEKVVAAMSF